MGLALLLTLRFSVAFGYFLGGLAVVGNVGRCGVACKVLDGFTFGHVLVCTGIGRRIYWYERANRVSKKVCVCVCVHYQLVEAVWR